MSTKPKRKPRPIGNPLKLVAAKTPIGEKDASVLLFPLASHLYEVAMGHGGGESMRIITLHLAATYDAACYYRHPGLTQAADKAGDLWLAAGDRCRAAGIRDRIVLTAAELTALRRWFCALLDLLPAMEVGAWGALLKHSHARWNRIAAARAE